MKLNEVGINNSDNNGGAQFVIDMFLNWQEVQKGYSNATRQAYSNDLCQFQNFLEQNQLSLNSPGQITANMVRAFIAFLHKNNLSKTSIARKLSAVRSLFHFLEKKRLLTVNPCSGLHNPKQNKYAPKILNVDECQTLLEQPDLNPLKNNNTITIRNKALVELLYGSGMRISEALNLNTADFQPGQGYIKVLGKGNRERLTPIGQAAENAICLWLGEREKMNCRDDALFVGVRGARLNRREANRIIKQMCIDANLNTQISPHGLRHSYASHMLLGGADLREIQELLGHKRITTTERYTHAGLDRLIKVYDASHPRND